MWVKKNELMPEELRVASILAMGYNYNHDPYYVIQRRYGSSRKTKIKDILYFVKIIIILNKIQTDWVLDILWNFAGIF